jgi:Electron transfer DM13
MGRMCTWWGAGGRPGAGARGGEGELEHVELGAPKGNQGNHNYDLPATVDLNQYQAVAIYCGSFHAIFGVARLEKF